MRSFSLARAVAAGAIVLALAGGTAAAEPFRLITTDLETALVPNSVMDLAERLGYFDREGVDVEIVRVQQTPSAVAALQAGEGEMANISLASALQIVAQNQLDIRAVTSPNKYLPYVIVAKDDIKSIEDLAGRSFGVGRVGSLDYSLSSMVMAAAGFSMDKTEVVAIGQPAARGQALAAGQIDATTMSIGVWMGIPDKTGLHILVNVEDYASAAPVVNKVNVVPVSVLENRRADVEAVVRALTKASRDFNNDPSIWVNAMVEARPDVPRENLEFLGKTFQGSWSVNGGMNAKELQFSEDESYKDDDLAGLPKVDLAQWADFSVADAVVKALGVDSSSDEPAR